MRTAGPGSAGASVSVEMAFDVRKAATVVLQVAVAADPATLEERLEIHGPDGALAVDVLPAAVGGRQHVVRAPAGQLTVRYSATVPGTDVSPRPVTMAERVEALRPSRYCPSDRVLGLAAAQFGNVGSPADTVRAICDYVSRATAYTAGSSGPSTDAVDTLLSGQGVCRDYAHAVATLCRAAEVPARVAAVYAPGLSPMDLHAVVEAEVDGAWHVWDATGLAPRSSLVRIATGRDAADTAFATVIGGVAPLQRLEVTAVAAGDLPRDDHRALAVLAAG